jgi:hypothetical protein
MNAEEIVDFYVANRVNPNADVLADGDYSAVLRWDSPVEGRPNRRSRPVRILLGRAYVEDFNNLSAEQQGTVGAELAERVGTALADYDERSDEQAPFVVSP